MGMELMDGKRKDDIMMGKKRTNNEKKRKRKDDIIIEKKRTNMVSSPSIECIPSEVIGEVLARVASFSLRNILNAKSSCKVFKEVGDEKFVYKHVSLDKLPVVRWRTNENAASFFKKCKDSENPEALYRQGVVDYFSNMKIESSLENLKKAANLGHLGALYVVGIISLFSGDEFKQAGMQILIAMKRSTSTKRRVRECRKNLMAIIRTIWIRNHVVLEQTPRCCLTRDQHAIKTGFPSNDHNGDEEDEDNLSCDACKCDREIASICGALPRIVF